MKLMKSIRNQFTEIKENRNNNIKICEFTKMLDNINQLTSIQIDNFFQWYTYAKKFFTFFDEETEGVLVDHHRLLMSHIHYNSLGSGESEIVFITADDADLDKKIKYVINVKRSDITIHRYNTCTNFEIEYTYKTLQYKKITQKSAPELFNIIKDFMKYCIKMRFNWCLECKEDIYETIPLFRFL